VDVAADRWRLRAPATRRTFHDLRAAVGVLDGANDAGLELGILKPRSRLYGLTDAYLFAKYRISGVLPGGALAVGGTFSTDKTHYSSVFLVGSSAISPSFTLHYGAGANMYGDPLGWAWFGGRRASGRADGGFALFGAEYDWRRLKLNVDYNGSFLSYGINYFPDSFFSLSLYKLGRGDFERTLGVTNGVGFGGTVRF
jgi:hypothetical protein